MGIKGLIRRRSYDAEPIGAFRTGLIRVDMLVILVGIPSAKREPQARLTWLVEVRLRSSSSRTSLKRVGWWWRGIVSHPGAA